MDAHDSDVCVNVVGKSLEAWLIHDAGLEGSQVDVQRSCAVGHVFLISACFDTPFETGTKGKTT